MPGKAPKSSYNVGPSSRDRVLSTLDKRTKAGRVFRQAVADLSAHVGGSPSAAERLIIQSAAVKAVRVYLLSEKLLSGASVDDDNNTLAWLNSMRQDLTALGLDSRLKDVTPSLTDYLASTAKEAAA